MTRLSSTSALRLAFAGTPDFAACHLAALLDSPHQIAGVFTQPDRPAGRGKKTLPSPVKTLAQQHNLPIFQPDSLRKAENQCLLADLAVDVLIVVAYGLILPAAVLNMPRFGCLNVHGSLLPRWRGAAPIQRALWAGDSQTGITIMQMNNGLDCGAILHQLACPVSPQDTSASLYQQLAQLGPVALLDCLQQLAAGQLTATPQDETQACYAKKLSKEEARLDWTLSAVQLERCVRAFNPWPVSYFSLASGHLAGDTFKVWQASVGHPAAQHTNQPGAPGTLLHADKHGIAVATADGVLNLQTLQPAGKKPMAAADLLNSRRDCFTPGTRLA